MDDIAATLKLEAKQLAAYAKDDPVLQAQAGRLALLADRLELTGDERSGTVDSVSELAKPGTIAEQLLAKTGLRVRALHRMITEQDGIDISHETLNNIFFGKKNSKATPEIRKAVLKRTGIKLP